MSASDKLALANAVITGVSVGIALIATIIAARAFGAQKALARRERRSTYYRAVVLEPAMNLLPEFEESASKLFSTYAAAIDECKDVKDARSILSEFVAAYRRLTKPVRIRLLRGAVAWRDEALRDEIGSAFLAIEDLNAQFPKLLSEPEIDPGLDEQMREAVGDLLGALVHYDLSAEVESRPLIDRIRSVFSRGDRAKLLGPPR